jgi:hypothetical protein
MVWAGPRSLAATSGVTDLFSFPAGTEMVHFPALASVTYGFSHGNPGMSRDGLPHSEICGSKLVCSSPQLIAAYHVLHRLLAPRHSPCALSSLTIRTQNCCAFSGSRLQTTGFSPCEPEVCSLEPVAAPASVPDNTHCVCVVGKLPLQNIQLSKNRRSARQDRSPASIITATTFFAPRR